MKMYLVPVCVALIFVISLIIPTLADTGPVNLTITSASEKDGYITTTLQVTPLIEGTGGYLTLWFIPSSGDCKDARMLGWRHLAQGNDTRTISMEAAVPIEVTPGSYTVTARYGAGNTIPASCDSGASAPVALVISTPGQDGHDMTGRLTTTAGSGSGPQYQISAITGIDTAIRVAPSSTILPGVTIRNTGADDISGEPVEVHAYLGSDELTPVHAEISPLKAGEVRDETLSYVIPGYIPQQSYSFFLIIDPHGEHGPVDPATSLKRTGGKMSVNIEDPGVGCGCHQ